MQTVLDILKTKEIKQTWSVKSDSMVLEALAVLAEKNVGALMVIDSDGTVSGIFSERDYTRKVILKGKASKDTTVSEIMTGIDQMVKVRPETSIDECMVLMTGKHIRHLPVFDDSGFLGIISIGDVLKSMIYKQADIIENLSNYIAGKYM